MPERPLFYLTPAVRKHAKGLYARQMWAWGQDIRHPEGNLLVRYGFQRQRQEQARLGGASEYSLETSQQHVIKLWSFGVSLYAPEQGSGILLKRHSFRPALLSELPTEILGRPAQLPPYRKAKNSSEAQQMYAFLTRLLDGFSVYEAWVQNLYGMAYRTDILHRHWKRGYRINLAQEWREIRLQILQEARHESQLHFSDKFAKGCAVAGLAV